jgi:tetratricopeptide (TPR) repeat protein
VDEVLRGDDEAQRMIGELQIEKTRQRAGMTTDEHRSPAARRQAGDAHVAQAKSPDPPPRKDLQLTARQKLEQQIVSNLADLEAYLELAQLHVAEERLGEAAHVLHKALAAAPEDPLVRERLEDVDILRKKRQLAQAEKRTASEPGEEAQQAVQKLRSELNQLEWETYHNRSQRRPEDREIKFQLGMRLKRLERIPEAMQCFEAAWHSPERRASASLELGECWQRLKQYGKALECYQRSANECKEDQRELKKLGLYRAGILASGLQNLDAAERSLAELLEMDPDFRDAATRLDKIRQIRDKH